MSTYNVSNQSLFHRMYILSKVLAIETPLQLLISNGSGSHNYPQWTWETQYPSSKTYIQDLESLWLQAIIPPLDFEILFISAAYEFPPSFELSNIFSFCWHILSKYSMFGEWRCSFNWISISGSTLSWCIAYRFQVYAKKYLQYS